mmetsp:Transcript_6234/g.8687  ORF Transcript_6234/g.8687 Transcript_6234/m.8687 type:complete len:774 (+) Transcript_6234:20-2341(+)
MRSNHLVASIALLLLSTVVVSRADILHCEADSRVDIEQTQIDSPVKDIQWISTNASDLGVVFVVSELGNLYRSADEGRTWTDQKSFLVAAKGSSTSYGVTSFVYSQANPNYTYILGKNRLDLWTSTDRGASYRYTALTSQIVSGPTPHPTNPQVALAVTASPKCFAGNETGYCYHILLITKDFGKTWKTIQTYIAQSGAAYAWAGNNIYVQTWTSKSGSESSLNLYSSYLAKSTNQGDSWSSYVDHVAGFRVKFDLVFIATISSSGKLSLYSSRNYGDAAINQAKFPSNVQETRYTILDTTDEFIFVSVEHDNPNYGSLYVSNEDDTNMVLSLPRNRRNPYGSVEFLKIAGLDGIYLANIVPDDVTDTSYSITMISYDAGGQWWTLYPPTKDYNGNPIDCEGCILNLFGNIKGNIRQATEYGPIYSKKGAVGLVLATGAVSQYIDTDEATPYVNTYISRDAGYSWKELTSGSHVYEFADHGGLTLMAKNLEETSTILYSWNEGYNLTECSLGSGNSFLVQDIISEPINTAETFIVYGSRYQGGIEVGLLFHVDFTNFHERDCTTEDYEYWSPVDQNGSPCVLGQTMTYKRRKQLSECFNEEDTDNLVSSKACACTIEDYECDFCFEPYVGDATICVQVCNDTLAEVPEDCSPGSKYYISKGYRLVDGDKCNYTSGVNLMPIEMTCPAKDDNNGMGSGGVVVLIIFITITVSALLVALGAYMVKKSERMQDFIVKHLPIAAGSRDPYSDVSFSKLSTDHMGEYEESNFQLDEEQ